MAILKLRYKVSRSRFLINSSENEFYWKLGYRSRQIVFQLVHPIRFFFLQRLRKKEVSSNYLLSLKPFDETKSIFVRIPKSAGRSLSISLYGCLVGSHIKFKEYQVVYSAKELDTYFKYTFVRNPWDRLVSAYFFLREGGVIGGDKMFADKNFNEAVDFEDFVLNYLRKDEVLSFTHFIPQHEFLVVKNKLCVDFVGYYENLVPDFEYIKEKLALDSSIKLEKNNITKSRSKKRYQDYYTEEMKQIVATVYQKDIALFGYTFENDNINQLVELREKSLSN